MDPNPLIWEAIAKARYDELLCQAEAERLSRGSTTWASVGRLLISVGRWFEHAGERLTATQIDKARTMGGDR
jgi:hypothetical protein